MKKYIVVMDFTTVTDQESETDAKREAFKQLKEAVLHAEEAGLTADLLNQIFEIDEVIDIDEAN